MINRQQIGKKAEQAALKFLQDQGFRLLYQNYTCYQGEIDLVMRDKEAVVFIEVRCKSRTDFGRAAESINRLKQKKIIRAATHFLQKKDWLYKVCSRFDVITIECIDGRWQIEWIKNAFWVEQY